MKDTACLLVLLPGCLPAAPLMCPFGPRMQATNAVLCLCHAYKTRATRAIATQLPVAAPISALLGAGFAPASRLRVSEAPARARVPAKAGACVSTSAP